jgi:O-antigen/teichoic acid export membrane protein
VLSGASNARRDALGSHAARGVLQGVVGRALSFVFAYVTTIILARRLGPAAYGTYGVVISVLLWIEQTARFTIPAAAAKLIAEDEDRSASVQGAALVLGVVLFALLSVLLWVAAAQLANLFGLDDGGARLIRIAALDLPFFGLYVTYRGVVQGHRDFLSLSIADVLYAGGKLIGVVCLVAVLLSLPGVMLVQAAASVGAWLFLASRISIRIRWPSSPLARTLIHLGLPLGLYMLSLQTITNLDLWSLKAFDPGAAPGTIGVYVAARNLAVVPGVVLMVVSDILLPSLSRAVASKDAELSRQYIQGAVRFVCIVIAPVAFLLMFAAEGMMALLYSEGFRSGGAYVRVLVLYAVSLPFMDLFTSALSARGEPYRGAVTLILVIPLVTALNVVLVESHGALGAAYGSALAGLLSTMVLGAMVARRFGSLLRFRTFANLAVATLLMWVAASQFAKADGLSAVAYAGCLAVYGLTLVILREVRRKDFELLAFWR